MVTVDLRDLVLLVAVDDSQIGRRGQVLAALAGPVREPVGCSFGVVGPRQVEPRRPGLLPPLAFGSPPRRLDLGGTGGLPGSSSLDGGLEEFCEFRDSRCSSRASRPARASFASSSSATGRPSR